MGVSIPSTPPNASINRVTIVDLPGLPIDVEVRKQKAYHLLSAFALIALARRYATALKLPEAYLQDSEETRRELPEFVDRCLGSLDVVARDAAQSIARRLGRNLGYILLTLQRGDAPNRAARQDWTGLEWQNWSRIRTVYVGGGIMQGELGRLIVFYARELLSELGYGEFLSVERAAFAAGMSLVGSARYLPPYAQHALGFDFGQTFVKRACFTIGGGDSLVEMALFPPLPVSWDWQNDPAAGEGIDPQHVLEFVAGSIAQTLSLCEERGLSVAPDTMVCIAAYVREGLLLGNGLYARMRLLAEDARPLIAAAIQKQVKREVRIHLIHDGTAAAALYAGIPDSAVLVIGTAIGVGFPPVQDVDLLRLREYKSWG